MVDVGGTKSTSIVRDSVTKPAADRDRTDDLWIIHGWSHRGCYETNALPTAPQRLVITCSIIKYKYSSFLPYGSAVLNHAVHKRHRN